MSLSTTTGSAERLHRAAGAWRLEFEQLVYNAPALLRPRRFAVSGEHAILQQLRELGSHEPLAKDAERLFARGAVPDGTYIARNGRWLPELRPDALEPETEPEVATAGTPAVDSSQLDELERRIASLENSLRALQKLVEGTMRALSDGASARGAAAAPIASPQPVMHGEDEAAAVGGGIPIAEPAAKGGGAGAGDPIAAAAAAIMTPRTEKPISLPTAAALTDLVRSLAGAGATLAPSERGDWPTLLASGPAYTAVIHDHDGEDVGAMIMDLEAALRLAGALLMESEELVVSLLEEQMMSDEMLDAASEVCNTLMSAFNKIAGNPHLRAGKLSQLDQAGTAWLEHARKRDDYRYSHGGRLTMALR